MNKKEIYLNRMKTLSLFKPNTISGKQGFVKIWGNSNGHCRYEHEKTKFDICFKLRTEYDYETWTEAELVSGDGRVDILALDTQGNGVIIEVLDSETNEKFNVKLAKYPLSIMKVHVQDFKMEEFAI